MTPFYAFDVQQALSGELEKYKGYDPKLGPWNLPLLTDECLKELKANIGFYAECHKKLDFYLDSQNLSNLQAYANQRQQMRIVRTFENLASNVESFKNVGDLNKVVDKIHLYSLASTFFSSVDQWKKFFPNMLDPLLNHSPNLLAEPHPHSFRVVNLLIYPSSSLNQVNEFLRWIKRCHKAALKPLNGVIAQLNPAVYQVFQKQISGIREFLTGIPKPFLDKYKFYLTEQIALAQEEKRAFIESILLRLHYMGTTGQLQTDDLMQEILKRVDSSSNEIPWKASLLAGESHFPKVSPEIFCNCHLYIAKYLKKNQNPTLQKAVETLPWIGKFPSTPIKLVYKEGLVTCPANSEDNISNRLKETSEKLNYFGPNIYQLAQFTLMFRKLEESRGDDPEIDEIKRKLVREWQNLIEEVEIFEKSTKGLSNLLVKEWSRKFALIGESLIDLLLPTIQAISLSLSKAPLEPIDARLVNTFLSLAGKIKSKKESNLRLLFDNVRKQLLSILSSILDKQPSPLQLLHYLQNLSAGCPSESLKSLEMIQGVLQEGESSISITDLERAFVDLWKEKGSLQKFLEVQMKHAGFSSKKIFLLAEEYDRKNQNRLVERWVVHVTPEINLLLDKIKIEFEKKGEMNLTQAELEYVVKIVILIEPKQPAFMKKLKELFQQYLISENSLDNKIVSPLCMLKDWPLAHLCGQKVMFEYAQKKNLPFHPDNYLKQLCDLAPELKEMISHEVKNQSTQIDFCYDLEWKHVAPFVLPEDYAEIDQNYSNAIVRGFDWVVSQKIPRRQLNQYISTEIEVPVRQIMHFNFPFSESQGTKIVLYLSELMTYPWNPIHDALVESMVGFTSHHMLREYRAKGVLGLFEHKSDDFYLKKMNNLKSFAQLLHYFGETGVEKLFDAVEKFYFSSIIGPQLTSLVKVLFRPEPNSEKLFDLDIHQKLFKEYNSLAIDVQETDKLHQQYVPQINSAIERRDFPALKNIVKDLHLCLPPVLVGLNRPQKYVKVFLDQLFQTLENWFIENSATLDISLFNAEFMCDIPYCSNRLIKLLSQYSTILRKVQAIELLESILRTKQQVDQVSWKELFEADTLFDSLSCLSKSSLIKLHDTLTTIALISESKTQVFCWEIQKMILERNFTDPTQQKKVVLSLANARIQFGEIVQNQMQLSLDSIFSRSPTQVQLEQFGLRDYYLNPQVHSRFFSEVFSPVLPVRGADGKYLRLDFKPKHHAMDLLNHLLLKSFFFQNTPLKLFKATYRDQNRTEIYPLQITPLSIGTSLKEIWTKKSNLLIDQASYSALFIYLLLTKEGLEPENLLVESTQLSMQESQIDFAKPYYRTRNKTLKLFTANALFCMDQMSLPLDQQIVKLILDWDVPTLIRSFLIDLTMHSKEIEKNFDPATRKNFMDDGISLVPVLPTTFIIQLLNDCVHLQKVLKVSPALSHLELLKKIDPDWAYFYSERIKTSDSPRERFYSMESKCDLTLKGALLRHLEKVLPQKCLFYFDALHTSFNRAIEGIENRDISSFKQIREPLVKEAVIYQAKAFDWNRFSKETQKELLDCFRSVSFRELNLEGCEGALSIPLLGELLSSSPNLQRIIFSNLSFIKDKLSTNEVRILYKIAQLVTRYMALKIWEKLSAADLQLSDHVSGQLIRIDADLALADDYANFSMTASPVSKYFNQAIKNLSKIKEEKSYQKEVLTRLLLSAKQMIKLAPYLSMEQISFSLGKEESKIHKAALVGSTQTLREEVERGVDLNIVDQNGSTPLICALFQNRFAAMLYLLQEGADVNFQHDANRMFTALHIAVQEQRMLATALLLSSTSLKVTLKDQEGWAAFYYAYMNGRVDFCELLIHHPSWQLPEPEDKNNPRQLLRLTPFENQIVTKDWLKKEFGLEEEY